MKAANKRILIDRKAEVELMSERLKAIKLEFDNIKLAEQEVFDGRSEMWQESERGLATIDQIKEVAEVAELADDAYAVVSDLFDAMSGLFTNVINS